MTINEKAVYLKGLADGLSYDKESAEGKLIAALIDLCGDMAEKLAEVDEDIEYLNDYIEEIDEDLGAVEETIYGDDCDCCDCDDDDCDCCCDDDCCEIECPACGETINFGCDVDVEDLVCPACGEKLAVLDAFEDDEN
ncbi:MAG: hypothetical protein IJY27_04710 [Clostridia bacterium]|nr:hypothetical protein [Clostridia bacterium]